LAFSAKISWQLLLRVVVYILILCYIIKIFVKRSWFAVYTW